MKANASVAQKSAATALGCTAGLVLQRQCSCGQHTYGGDCSECDEKRLDRQRESGQTLDPVPAFLQDVLRSPGQRLGNDAQTFAAPLSSFDLSRVPVQSPPPLARSLKIGSVDDPLELAAERFSERVAERVQPPSARTALDFGAVSIHTGQRAAAAARAVNARAFTVGEHIVFDEGEYQPGTQRGQRLLAHELAHVLQQSSAPAGSAGIIHRQPAAANAISPTPGSVAMPVMTGVQADAKASNTAQGPPVIDSNEAADSAASETMSPRKPEIVSEKADKKAKPTPKAAPKAAKPEANKTGEKVEDAAEAEPKSMDELPTGELDLIDRELAEHERWSAAAATVGAAGSQKRAEYIAGVVAEGSKSGITEGLKGGIKSGVGLKVAEKLAEKALVVGVKLLSSKAGNFVPVPGLGAAIGGAIAAYDLASRDWSATGEALGKFGKGADIYDKLANSIEAASTALEVATQVLNVIAGVLGAITVVMWIATVATAGVLSPVAGTLTAIAGAIQIGTLALDAINALVLKRLIVLFRSLHEFTSEADPRDVVTQGQAIEQAASASTGFLGGVAGGFAVEGGTKLGAKGVKAVRKALTPIPDHPTPPPAAGQGPLVKAQPPAPSEALKAGTAEAKGTPTEVPKPAEAATAPTEAAMGPKATPLPPEPGPSGSSKSLKGKVVHAAALQLAEKFEMGAGVPPGERIRVERRAATLKKNLDAELGKAGTNLKKQQTARSKYKREVSKIASRRQALQNKAWREFWKAEGRTEPIDVDAMFAGWDEAYGPTKTGVGVPIDHPLVPDIELPIEYSEVVSKPGQGVAKPGTIARHSHQPARGSSLISEHVNPGAQFKFATKGKSGSIYSESQYGQDYTIQLPKEVSDIKTYEGPTADNARTRALKAKAESGGRIDVTEDLFLGGIKETFRAIDVADQRKALQTSTPISQSAGGAPASGVPIPSIKPSSEIPRPAQQAGPEVPKGVVMGNEPSSGPEVVARHPTVQGEVGEIEPPRVGGEEPRIRVATGEEGAIEPEPESGAESPEQQKTTGVVKEPSTGPETGEARKVRVATGENEPPKVRVDVGENEPPKVRVASGEDAALEAEPESGAELPEQQKKRLPSATVLPVSAGQGSQQAEAEKKEPFAAGLRRNLGVAAHMDPRKLPTDQKIAYLAGGPVAVSTLQGYERASTEPMVEHVNPNYPPPPCSPQDIIDIRNEVLRTLDARAEAKELSWEMAGEAAHHKANEEPLKNMDKRTQDALSATEAHKQTVGRREDANQKKQDNEKQAGGTLSDYANRASKLAMLTGPLRAFTNFTSLAYALPDSPDEVRRVKQGILKMNSDARRFLGQLEQVEKTVTSQKDSHPDREKQTETDHATLRQTDQHAQQSNETFDKTKQKTEELTKDNEAKRDEAKSYKQQADQSSTKLEAHAEQKKAQAQSMAASLQSWAQAHEQARLDSLEQTKKRLEAQGYKITEVKPL